MDKRLRDIGEFKFIKKIGQILKRPSNSVIKGIGDDCAIIKYAKDKHLLFTTDMIIEGVHFNARTAMPEEIGYKALAVNISDIAACGGMPKWATVSLGVPSSIRYDYIKRVYKGMVNLASRFKIDIVGGDTNSSDKIIISIALIGEVEKNCLTLRSGAKDKDIVLLTGRLKKKPDDITFTPRLKEARYLVKNFKINSMIDISDGFLSDLSHILEESGKSAIIYESLMPLETNTPAMDMLGIGEQFELLFTVPQREAKRLAEKFYPVGEIREKGRGITYVTRKGTRRRLGPRGYSHF
jgi:thiamine-monophosphate kinase